MKLTICYMTSREEPRIEWFFRSLKAQSEFITAYEPAFNVMVVDFHAEERPQLLQNCRHVAPKPSVWQGPHRKTREDFFAASNARNTALCLCETEYIAYVDDLSVLMPGWLSAVLEACNHDRVTLGAYRKVYDLTVNDEGIVTHFRDAPLSHDLRRGGPEPVRCRGQWLYGCSLVGRTEHFLTVGGWPEALCDGMGYEDTTMGTMMENNGIQFVYDARMVTWESEELHFVGKKMRRDDYGVSPNDKSHAVVNASQKLKYHENYFGSEGIRGLRQRVLAGESFPIPLIPEHEWFTSRPLGEL